MTEKSLADKFDCKLAKDKESSILDEDILKKLNKKCERIVVVTGTNGKTTTANILNHILSCEYDTITNIDVSDKIAENDKEHDIGLLEVDPNSMTEISKYVAPDFLVITNFFRDQLDTFGEVETAIGLVHDSIRPSTKLVLNADDPSTYYFNDLDNEKIYFHQNNIESAKGDICVAEFLFCPKCGSKLDYDYVNYGNIGGYKCINCDVTNPEAKYNLTDAEKLEKGYSFEINGEYENNIDVIGNYNLYNGLAAVATSFELGIDPERIADQIGSYKYKQGRTEFIEFDDKKIILGLTKNPIAASEQFISLKDNESEKSVLFILNDYEIDGEDVSWIWDIDLDSLNSIKNIRKFYCLGSRRNDFAIRLKYSDFDMDKVEVAKDSEIDEIIKEAVNENDEIHIMGTPSGICESKKIIEGGI